jgi:hypothetical protein
VESPTTAIAPAIHIQLTFAELSTALACIRACHIQSVAIGVFQCLMGSIGRKLPTIREGLNSLLAHSSINRNKYLDLQLTYCDYPF